MINRQMKPYLLYEKRPGADALGRPTNDFILVGEVMAAVNFLSYSQIHQLERYRDCRYTGLTAYKGFQPGKEYKLVPKETYDWDYLVKSVNTCTRLTQLILQEVIISE